MKFDSRSGNRRSQTQFSPSTPAIVESLETRALLAAPQIVSPTGTITDSTPTVTWEAVDTATTYDLWISDVESREILVLQEGLTTTSFAVPNELNLGRLRIWARANFANGSTTGWGTPTDVLLQVAPTITGPLNNNKPATPTKIDTVTPTVTWTSPPGARSFEVFLSNQTERTSKSYRVANVAEVRSFQIPDELTLGQYRVFMRTTDDAGKVSGWSAAYDFEVAPEVKIERPAGPVFQEVQVVTVNVSGTPTSGNYTVAFSVWSNGQSTGTYRATLPFNATSEQVQAAVRALPGFGSVVVNTTGTAPNLTHRITLHGITRPVTVVSTETVTPGTATAATVQAQGILLEWKAVPGATHYEVFVARRGANEATPIYNPQYLTTTSYRIPALLATGEYVFWVRARRLHQVTQVALSGSPTSGTYKLSFATTTTSATGVVTTTRLTTGAISYNATAADVQAAIRALTGFDSVVVTTSGKAPNLTHLVQIPQLNGPVKVTVTESVIPGTVTATTSNLPEVVGLWSARSDFSTIQAPVISAPVGVGANPAVKLVTDVRPTIEWTAIDGAARYELWIDRTASSTRFLLTDVATNSYTLTSNIPAGNYWVWVRAFSANGTATPWSEPYKFTATGGAPVITSPTDNQTTLALPTITWVGVTNAVSYDIHIAWIGVDFTYIERTGITNTSFTPENPLNQGSYRVWVRAVLADGTTLPWSTQTTFIVADADAAPQGDADSLDVSALLTSLPSHVQSNAAKKNNSQAKEVPVADEPPAAIVADDVQPPGSTDVPVESEELTLEGSELIAQLAEACVDTEWWTEAEKS